MDIIADTYRDGSIKSGEREKRESAAKVIIALVKSKLPRDMNQFMLNNVFFSIRVFFHGQ